MISKTLMEEIQKIKTKAELHEAWDYMKAQATYIENMATLAFHVGEKVWFTHSKSGKRYEGVVTRINQKSVSLSCGKDGNWKVSASMLKKVEK